MMHALHDDVSPHVSSASSLVYGLDERPSLQNALCAAMSHLLAICIPIITPPILVARALNFSPEKTRDLVAMALIISGVATFIQVRRWKSIGSGLLTVQGTSFLFVSTLIAIGHAGGLPLILGMCMAGSFVEIALSRFIPLFRKIMTPLISGIIVTLIGISLIGTAMHNYVGGSAALANGTYGSVHHILLATATLASIVIAQASKNKYIRMAAILIGVTIGYCIALWTHGLSLATDASATRMIIPVPFKYGIAFDVSFLIPISLIYVVTSMETFGDITATALVSGQPIHGKKYYSRIAGGILADGINSFIAGIFGTLPNTTFSQNNGIIQLTGVASRYVGYFIAALLICIGIFPPVASFFALMPTPVLGGATLLMFGSITAAGIRLITQAPMNHRSLVIIAVSLACGIGIIVQPDALNALPPWIKTIFSSGIVTGGLVAIICHLIMPHSSPTDTAA